MSVKLHEEYVSGAQMLKLLERAVEEVGSDYVDPLSESGKSCRYFTAEPTEDHKVPRCIVGQALHYLGISDALLLGADQTASVLLKYPFIVKRDDEKVVLRFTEDAAEIADAAQSQQDCGTTWGTAVQIAASEESGDDDE